MINRRLILLGFLLLQLSSCFSFPFGGSGISHAKKAAQLRSEGKYDEAISEYQKHIEVRLADSRRENEENPYFYEIMIGDIYLQRGDSKSALESYLSAQKHDVETPLIVDRIRKIAKYYREQQQYREAIELLKQYRELDDFIFDVDIDENAKLLIQSEDSADKASINAPMKAPAQESHY